MNAKAPRFRQEYLRPAQAAEFLGIPASTLARWRSSKLRTLPYIRIGGGKRGGMVFYRLQDLRAFMDSQLTGQRVKDETSYQCQPVMNA